MKSVPALLLGLCVAAPCFAGPQIFGLELGGPLKRDVAVCPAGNVALNRSPDYCARFSPLHSGQASDGGDLLPPWPVEAAARETMKIPSWLRSVRVSIVDGVVAEMLAATPGIRLQPTILDALAVKFGPPSTRETVTAANGFGAKFEYERATWKAENAVILSSCAAVDSCYILLQTPAQAERALKERAEQARKDKL